MEEGEMTKTATGQWGHWNTGGGCAALGMNLPDGGYILVTEAWGGEIPRRGERACVGKYNADGDWVDEKVQITTFYGETTLTKIHQQYFAEDERAEQYERDCEFGYHPSAKDMGWD